VLTAFENIREAQRYPSMGEGNSEVTVERMNKGIVSWLLEGDVSIQYQTYRDLLDTDKPRLQKKIESEGWGFQFLCCRKKNGHWGRSFYSGST